MHWCQTMHIVVLAVLLPLIPWVSNADVVVLKNGDRITGRIVKMEDRLLEIESKIVSDAEPSLRGPEHPPVRAYMVTPP